jgi:hypothetical protein
MEDCGCKLKTYKILDRKPEGKKPRRGPRSRLEDNIKQIGCEFVG